ncbi:MAG: ATP-binding cassette domain-containing protein, partial [Lachnospiraceae bacterium]
VICVFESDVSFVLHIGEILGFSGLVGAGRTELMRAVMGIDRPECGQVYLDGKEIRCRSALEAKKEGIVLIPEERKTEGLVLSMSIEDNIALTYEAAFSFMGVLSKRKLEENAEDIIEKLTIKPADRKKKALNLSGGNQQKIVIGKWIYKNHKVLVFDEPTRGVDVGAKAEIYKVMADLAGKGIGIIMVSSDLPEIIGMSDRVIVMKEGNVSGELKREELEEDRIMRYAF